MPNDICSIENSDQLIEKFIKPKTRKLLKIKKLFKFQKLFKLKKPKSEKLAKFKKPSINRNLFYFDIKKIELSFLISNAKTTFNRL